MLILYVNIRALYHQSFQNFSKYCSESCSGLGPLCPVLSCLPLAPCPKQPTPNQNTQKNHKRYLPSKTNLDDACLLPPLCRLSSSETACSLTVVSVNVFWHKDAFLSSSPSKRLAHVYPERFSPRAVGKKRKREGSLTSQGIGFLMKNRSKISTVGGSTQTSEEVRNKGQGGKLELQGFVERRNKIKERTFPRPSLGLLALPFITSK